MQVSSLTNVRFDKKNIVVEMGVSLVEMAGDSCSLRQVITGDEPA
jgi:hypothetical protein